MSDALSIIGGFAAVIQISQVVVGYIKAVKGANVERQRLLAEINGTAALCQTLQDTAEIDVEQWIQTLRVLSREETGPLCQFKRILEDLQRKLAPGRKPKSRFIVMIHDLGWPFKQDDFRNIILTIERQKSLFDLALTNDNLRLSMAILKTTQQMADTMEIVRVSQRVLEEKSHMIVESIESHHISHDEEMQRLQEIQAQDKKQALLSQLTTIDFEAVHADISSRRTEDTGQWLLESGEYISWRDKGSSTVLWCPGLPGAGKTVLASLIIDSLRQPESGIKLVAPANLRNGVAAVYCSYRSSDSTSNLLGSVFGQFLAPVENVQSMNVSQIEDPKCMQSTLQAFKEHYEKLFLVIDALDECSDVSNLLKQFRDIMEIGKSNGLDFHILITGRPSVSAEIERYLRPDGHLEIKSRDEDVRKYLQQSLCSHGQLSDWIASDLDFENLIIDSILARLSGMFLLARLYMDILNHTPTKRGVRKALSTLPLGIHDTYAEAWNRVMAQRPQQAELGKRVLLWVIHTTRPLRKQELQYALAVEEGDEEFDLEGLVDAKSLTSFCAGLVIINEQSNLVSLVHPTTQEYFSERKADLFPGAHEEIARVCIAYLRMKPLVDEGALRSKEAFHQRWRSSPLLGYTAVNWGLHVRTADTEQATKLSLLLLNEDNARLAASQALILNVIGSIDWDTEWPDQSDDLPMADSVVFLGPLHLAAYFGLNDSAKALIQQGIDVNALDGINGNPLHWALIEGHNDMLGSLLDHGANANLERDQVSFRRWHMIGLFTLPLSIAAFLGNVKAIEILISYGAEVNKPQSNYSDETSLSVALYACQHDAARILLDRGADVNLEPRGISEAATHGSFETLKMVIEGGTNQEGIQQALAAAASSGQDEKVVFLLQHGANADGPPVRVGRSTDGSLPQGETEVEDKDGRSCWEAATPLVSSIMQT